MATVDGNSRRRPRIRSDRPGHCPDHQGNAPSSQRPYVHNSPVHSPSSVPPSSPQTIAAAAAICGSVQQWRVVRDGPRPHGAVRGTPMHQKGQDDAAAAAKTPALHDDVALRIRAPTTCRTLTFFKWNPFFPPSACRDCAAGAAACCT